MILRQLALVAVFFCIALTAHAQLAGVTFVHSSPEPSLRVIDLYVTQAGITSKVDDITFQAASNLNEVAIYGDIEVTFSIAPSSSVGISESVYEESFTPLADRGYMAVFTGVLKPSDYVVNPEKKPIEFDITPYEVPSENNDPNKTAVYFFHASTDLEAGDVWARGGTKAAAANIGYLGRSTTAAVLERKATTIDFTKAGDKTKVLASFSVDLSSLASNILVCVVSGFKSPGDNAKSTDTLALLNVLEDGRVVRSPLLAGSQKCRVQVIHASADPAFSVVDLWLNGVKTFDNIAFRRASAFVDAPANTPLVIGLAPATSNAYKDTIATITLEPLRPQRTYSIVAVGVGDTSKFAKNPGGVFSGFQLKVYDGALEKNATTKTGVRTLHAISDAPQVSFASAKTTYATKIGYTDMTPSYIETDPGTDTVWMSNTDDQRLKGYICDFRGASRAAILVATGFMDPTKNGNGPGPAVILVDDNGNVNSNIQAIDPNTTSVQEEALIAAGMRLGPNPTSGAAEFFVSSALASEPCSFEVFDGLGNVVLSGPMSPVSGGQSAVMTVATLANGSYRVMARTSGGSLIGAMGLVVTR
ncbi:MAG: DUF4397 domain-containing protein [Candidatus Kapabacteria bacterium]|nr:DUF4397 domain-containing protein [Candidatus Kapabacteria bacterium]